MSANDRFTLAYCHKITGDGVSGGWALTNSAVCGVCQNYSMCKHRQPVMPSKETDLYVLSRGFCQKVGTFKNTVNGVDFNFERDSEETIEAPNSEEGESVPS